MSLEKDELRKQLWAKRLNISASEQAAKSKLIADKLIKGVNWQSVKSLHIYSSVNDWNEVDTRPILDFLQDHWSGIEVISPSSNPGPIDSGQVFDLIIVPCLGFDKDCYRIGLGGGYYDRFLASQPQAVKIGLCFEASFLPNGVPNESHDVELNKIITEEKILESPAN